MLMRSALLGGVAALGASAMLVIPEMEPNVDRVEDGFGNVDPIIMENARHAVLELPCAECPFRANNERGVVSWMEGKPSSLTLDFSVADNALLANGRRIFPPAQPLPILAVQQNEDGEVSTPMPVGYTLEIMPTRTSDEGYELLDIRLTILDLDAHPVPVDTVAITVLQDPNGELFITQTEIVKSLSASDPSTWKECHGKAKCLQELLISRIRGLLAGAKDRMMSMATSGAKTCHDKYKAKTTIDPDSLSFGYILVLVVVSTLAGVIATAVGMLVRQVVILVWQRYRGTEPAEYQAVWENGEACEKQGLMAVPRDPEDALPEYTEHSQVQGPLGGN
ncbi:hypothetical protein N7535_003137 [Penicillium sp. DV-2018c]|nr:hypothetical protein N7461_001171 [Penicillium sp. DV-2018c]KAJ5576211.1 hypothetical protein N7535_003137 [Penicillium sp. DV-2018c]